MDQEIINAKKLLQDNGYIVIKMNKAMIADADECEAMAERGEDKECDGCSCSCCLIQPYN
jgi:hypothetical protein